MTANGKVTNEAGTRAGTVAKRLVRLAVLQALGCASGLLLATTTRANADPAQFDIGSQPLPDALRNFAAQAKMQLLYRYDVVRHATANPVTGHLEKHVALEQMLRGTGLEAIYSGVDTATIRLISDQKLAPSAESAGGDKTSAVRSSPTSSTLTPIYRSYLRLAQAETSAQAQPPAEEGVQEVVVTGTRQSLVNSMTIKRDSLGIVDAISPEDIGKLPDTNLAESLQRITGVSIDRSGGEGAFVTVRGFGPEFNTVLVNGRQIATPTDPSQASGRAFSFDTLASELISGVEVFKSSVARLQSGGVGSAIDIHTARPFDYNGIKFSASADANYEQNSGNTSPDAAFLASDRFLDGRLGILVSGSYQRRKDRLDQAQTDGWIVNGGTPVAQINGGAGTVSASNPQGNLFIPQNFDSKVTFEDRKRVGGTLVLQFKASDDLTLTADTLYSRFTNTTDARSYGHWFTPSNLTNVVTDANGTAVDLTQGVGMASDFHDKKFDKKTDLSASGVNAEWKLTDRMTLNLDGSYSRAKEDPNGGAESELALLGYGGQTIRYRSDGAILPFTSGFVNPTSGPNAGVAGGTHPLFEHVMLYRGYGVEDKVGQLRADLQIKGDSADQGLASLRVGALFSRDEKDRALYSNDGGTGCATCGYNNPAPASIPIGVFDTGGGFLSGVSGANRLTTRWLTFDGPALFNAITQEQQALTPGFTFAPPKVNDSLVKERVYGGYLETVFAGTLNSRPISTVVGVRVERTQADISGLATKFVALTTLINDATQYGVSTAGTATLSSSNTYTDILPNLSFKWNLSDDITARFAASQTMTRPTLEQLSPVTTLVTLRPGNFAAASGTPDLKPFRSNNLDVSFEYYYGRSNFLSVGAYYKNVDNFIVLNQTTGVVNNSAGTPLLDPVTGAPAQFIITAPTNGESAQVYGLEAGILHSFGESGFGVQLNGTLAHSDKKLDPRDLTNKFALTGLSNSANGVLFYDKDKFEARTAINWREHFLQYLSPPPLNGAGQAVTQVRSRYQVDASATYHIDRSFAVFVEGVNLTNRDVLKYAYYENQFLYAEDSGRRYKLGVRAQF